MIAQPTPALLKLCARSKPHPDLQQLLVAACRDISNWEQLLQQAEEQGLAPLVNRHLKPLPEHIPASFLRGLRFLSLRHKQANAVLMQSLQHILSLLNSKGIPCLVLKGAALCHLVYPKIGLRPMRDIDLLLAPNDVQHAHAFLLKNGFRVSTSQLPADYYHLPPLFQIIDNVQVCIELHHGLFPDDPPYYTPLPFKQLYDGCQSFTVNGQTAYAPAGEEMLWHIYQHGFHAPLTYEPFKLISAADIISLVESRAQGLDWDKIKKIYPTLYRALPLLHFLSPWQEHVLDKIPLVTKNVPSGAGEPYRGWPRPQSGQLNMRARLQILRDTIFPSRWWLMLYYGTGGQLSLYWCRAVQHPIHIVRWIKIRSRLYKTTKKMADRQD